MEAGAGSCELRALPMAVRQDLPIPRSMGAGFLYWAVAGPSLQATGYRAAETAVAPSSKLRGRLGAAAG
jgi:hypothetical protein